MAIACQLISGERRDVLLPSTPAVPQKEVCWTCEAVGCLLQGWQRGSFKDRSSVLNRRDKTSSLGYSDRRQQQTRFVIFLVVFSSSLSFTSCYTHGSLDWVLDDGILFDFIFLTLCVGVERREPEAWNGGGKAGGRRGERYSNSIRPD